MIELSTEQMLYLLYAVSYSEEGTVTKGTVKSYLPKDQQKNADSIYEALSQNQLIESPKRYRLSVTDQGFKALVANLQTTEYKFDSNKGPKLVNAIVHCFKLASSEVKTTPLAEEMDFDTFVEKFKALYLEERKRQELKGVVAIRSQDICQKFMEHNPISQATLDKYFEMLKSTGKVFAVTEKDDELIQWAE
ncbi:MAG TPA: hypothetical protein DCE56_43770 [Cyanobacteria bacterium UBA8553]|nr:hypothetical protein [Cyanobacteria bacterium UBA8553]HAJ61896.1 hypothetical protein [Cyanobacteria bacterium UBA8543]